MEAFVRSGGRRGATRELALELSGVDEASAAQALALRALNGCEGMKALSVFGRVDPYALILSPGVAGAFLVNATADVPLTSAVDVTSLSLMGYVRPAVPPLPRLVDLPFRLSHLHLRHPNIPLSAHTALLQPSLTSLALHWWFSADLPATVPTLTRIAPQLTALTINVRDGASFRPFIRACTSLQSLTSDLDLALQLLPFLPGTLQNFSPGVSPGGLLQAMDDEALLVMHELLQLKCAALSAVRFVRFREDEVRFRRNADAQKMLDTCKERGIRVVLRNCSWDCGGARCVACFLRCLASVNRY